jgi:hypothetical protein
MLLFQKCFAYTIPAVIFLFILLCFCGYCTCKGFLKQRLGMGRHRNPVTMDAVVIQQQPAVGSEQMIQYEQQQDVYGQHYGPYQQQQGYQGQQHLPSIGFQQAAYVQPAYNQQPNVHQQYNYPAYPNYQQPPNVQAAPTIGFENYHTQQ